MKNFVMSIVFAIGILLLVAGIGLGAPFAVSVLALDFNAVVSWAFVSAFVGVVVGSWMALHAFHQFGVD